MHDLYQKQADDLVPFRICHLYGNLLNTYGDNGNLLVLQYVAREMGMNVEVELVSIGDSFDPTRYDLVFFGGGQDYEQKIVSQHIPMIRQDLQTYIESGRVLLAICGGYQLLGHYYVNAIGDKIPGLGLIDLHTERQNNSRFTGDIEIYSEVFDRKLQGFENHNGVTYLGEGIKALGHVLSGNGNNGQDQGEGCHYKNVFCSYFHGPMLVRNPWLAEELIDLAIQNKDRK